MNTQIRLITLIGLALIALAPAALAQTSGNSSITYQGRLALDGLAVNENCDVIFRLYDAAAGGNLVGQVGDELSPRVVIVRKGLFTQPLDFGGSAFNGGERWLEIAVRPTGTFGAFSVLHPRQCVTPTPYALHALSGGDVSSLDQAYNKGGPGAGRTINAMSGPMSIEGDGGLVVSGSVGVGTQTPGSKLEVAGVIRSTSGGFMFPDGTTQITAAGNGDGSRGTTFWNDDGTDIFTDPVTPRVGIGTMTPSEKLHVASNDSDGTRVLIDNPPHDSNAWSLFVEGTNAFPSYSFHIRDEFFDITHLSIDTTGNVGIGTEQPDERLQVNGKAKMLGLVLPTGASAGRVLTSDGIGEGTWQAPTGGPPTGPAGGDLTGDYPNPSIAGNAVNSGKIADGQVMTADLANDSVDHNKLASDALSLVEVSGGVMQVAGANIDIPAPGKLVVNNISSHSPLIFEAPLGTERMRIDDATGNVGISDTSPSATLTVGNGDKFQVSGADGDVNFADDLASITFPATDATNSPMIHMFASGTTNGNRMVISHSPSFVDWGLQYQDVGNKFHFLTSGNSVMTVDLNNSRVGIGTTSPAFKLDVAGDVNVAPPSKLHVDTITSHSPLALQTAGETHILIDDSTGNVGIGPNGVGPPLSPDEALHVNGCIKADCLKITADNVVEIAPLVMTRAGTGVELFPSSNGTVRIHPVAAGTQNVMIPISIPNSLFGVQQKLKSVEICYKATSPTTFINASRVRVMRDAGLFTNLIDDPTDRKNTAWSCYTIGPPLPGEPPLFPPLDGPSFINLELTIGGVAPSYDIEIGRIKLTLTEEV